MNAEEIKAIGKRIKLLREQEGFTQKTLAEILNVTPGAVSKWEKGENAAVDHISRIAEVFGVLCFLMS